MCMIFDFAKCLVMISICKQLPYCLITMEFYAQLARSDYIFGILKLYVQKQVNKLKFTDVQNALFKQEKGMIQHGQRLCYPCELADHLIIDIVLRVLVWDGYISIRQLLFVRLYSQLQTDMRLVSFLKFLYEIHSTINIITINEKRITINSVCE